ncbi:MAG: hypothetical protein ACRD3T_13895 [Terriglobia bacterium]
MPELDFSNDLFAEPIAGSWVRLATRTILSRRGERGVKNTVFRQCLLLTPDAFAAIFDRLDSVGNLIDRLGKPGGSLYSEGRKNQYAYSPFHRFHFPFVPVVGEPLVFLHSDTSTTQLFINPDLWMFLELEERAPGHGIWWDPRRGVDALVRRVIDDGALEIVEICIEYLLKYLQARQMSLVICHYRQLLFFDPPHSAIEAFVKEDVTLGCPKDGAKAILQNWGLREGIARQERYLQRRLHLWFEIRPPQIDLDDPWSERPAFDPYTLTLPTSMGAVAPARWARFRGDEGGKFEGETCDFMDRIYFRQEVLTKYEGASGFDVEDDGSVSCRGYWGLTRSTARIGNELICTGIGDFAEGVPYDEWPHWKQYAVEPPSPETLQALVDEPTLPDAVNAVVRALERLNSAFANMAATLGLPSAGTVWDGSLDSLAARQMKWVYPANASDDEFLTRATLASTLFLDGLQAAPLRDLLKAVGTNLHQTFEKEPKPLGSRKLLQRVALMALLVKEFEADSSQLSTLVQQAEGKITRTDQPDLQVELEGLHKQIRDEFAPLAFLYDLRTHGGLAHRPDRNEAEAAAVKLGLPKGHWHRTDYLCLLKLIAESVRRISEHLEAAAQIARH